jgi:hypothetical protein
MVAASRKGNRTLFSYQPKLEILENRTLLSDCTVSLLTDAGNKGDLHYCIAQAGDGDTISFMVAGTINLSGALPDLTHSINIARPGTDQLTVRRNKGGTYRIFTVTSGTTVSISGLTIADGRVGALFPGAGISNQGTLMISNCTVANNRGDGVEVAFGGGIYNSGSLTVENCLITGNVTATVSGGGGGGIANNSGGGGYGGAIRNEAGGTATVTATTFSGNVSTVAGGVSNRGIMTLSGSTFSSNMGGLGRGAIENLGTMIIGNGTISGNTAEGGGAGIGNGGTLTITNSTIAGNSNTISFRGGGIENSDGTLNMRNTILAGNTDIGGAPDLYGSLTSSGYNLLGNTQGGSGYAPTDLLNVDPLLGPLQDNGGPTLTMALQCGSPAIDAGDTTNAPD